MSTSHQQTTQKMSAEDDSSDLSSLSSLSPAPSDIELDEPVEEPVAKPKKGIQKYFSKATDKPAKEASPPLRKRSPSPPHEYVLADNPDIAVCVSLSYGCLLFTIFSSTVQRVSQLLRRAAVAHWTSRV
jgi:hypothetical protein